MKSPLDRQALKNKVITFLARREYSRAELVLRLKSKAESPDILEDVLDELEAAGYQSDRRFAEIFIRNRLSQCWGLERIRYELRQKGICPSLTAEVLQEQSPDWDLLARTLVEKRFGETLAADLKEQARRLRYLVNHGFSYDQAQRALKTDLQ
ncbi:regulatory protein RecX [Nitrincola iocasae]|uniref:Regulatory protein RecX n=1 Tax=Nitrincola iocasae TaxID=2614693 RepID=A0A5J6LGN8_9GAMM|nr:regulatory protein RecX [Nitrincola iocasae]QEW07684.1 regulatory protein RecX [Nitrincola iocasae]